MAFNSLDHAHRFPLSLSRLVLHHVLKCLLLIMQHAQYIHFESVKAGLLCSQGKFIQSFETVRVDVQYMLFLVEGSLAMLNVLVACNRSGLQDVLEAV